MPRQNTPSPDFSVSNGSWQSPEETEALRSAYHRGRVAGLREAEKTVREYGCYDAEDGDKDWEMEMLANWFAAAADKLEAETP